MVLTPLWWPRVLPFTQQAWKGGTLVNPRFTYASLVTQMVKNLPAVQETQVRSLGREDPLEKEMATHSSVLAGRIPWTEEPGGLQSTGSQRVGNDWATNTSTLSRSSMSNCSADQLSSVPRGTWSKRNRAGTWTQKALAAESGSSHTPSCLLERKHYCVQWHEIFCSVGPLVSMVSS